MAAEVAADFQEKVDRIKNNHVAAGHLLEEEYNNQHQHRFVNFCAFEKLQQRRLLRRIAFFFELQAPLDFM